LIAKDGVRFDPNNMEALQTMQEPQNGADLVQYAAAVKWMRSTIPDCFAARTNVVAIVMSKITVV
jgi:hypothetical protein